MEAAFWQDKWNKGEIGFHLDRPHPKLLRHWPALQRAPGDCVMLPLAGKSLDIDWLLAQGHAVCAMELSGKAVAELLARQLGAVRRTPLTRDLTLHEVGRLRVYEGDFFALTPAMLPAVDAVYDRAALVALPADMRRAYVSHVNALSRGAAQLLLTLEYAQNEMNGPPFAVSAQEVATHYGERACVCLERHAILEYEPRFAARGVTALHEVVWSIGPAARSAGKFA